MKKSYLVTMWGPVWFDTTVAVHAESAADAADIALAGVDCDVQKWRCMYDFFEDPSVGDVSEESMDELRYADQQHLLGQP